MLRQLGDQDLRPLRDRALLTLGFAGAFRRSELVALDLADLEWTDDGLKVRVRRSKTDQAGEGATIGIPRGTRPDTCPAANVRRWIDAAAIESGPLFVSVNRHGHLGARLRGGDVARIVKRCAEAAGLEVDGMSGHSLRVGLATQAALAGKADRAIMRHGRWKTRAMVDRYVRDLGLFENNAASGIGL